MASGIRVRDAAGNTMFDTSTVGALFADEFLVAGPAGEVMTKTYPALGGMTVLTSVSPTRNNYAFGQSSSDFVAYVTADYALGYPRLSIRAGVEETVVYVLAR